MADSVSVRTSIQRSVTDDGVSVYGFNVITRGVSLRSVLITRRGGGGLAGPYQFSAADGVWAVHIPLGIGSEIAADTPERSMDLRIGTHDRGGWTLEIVQTADRWGKEIIGGELGEGGPLLCRMSPKATGVVARLTNRTGKPIEELRLSLESLDADGEPPVVLQAQETTGVFQVVTVEPTGLVISGGSLEPGETAVVDIQFLEEVGGSLGAELTVAPRAD